MPDSIDAFLDQPTQTNTVSKEDSFLDSADAFLGPDPVVKPKSIPKKIIDAASYVGGIIPGTAEAVAGGIASMGIEAASGLAGLATLGTKEGFQKGYKATKEVFDPIEQSLAPETKAGKDIAGVLSKIPEAIHAGGEKAFEATKSPLAAATVEGAGTLASLLLPAKIGKMFKGAPKPEAPSTIPKLTETAFRDKDSGVVHKTGVKHPDKLKQQLAETHEQGFVDEQGKFYSRQDAITQAEDSGQLPKNSRLEKPEEGLHSGDLRTAGAKEFDLAADKGIKVVRKGSYIDSVDIPEHLQKQGVGTKVVKDLESKMSEEGYSTSFLQAKEESVPFWEKQGYKIDDSYVHEKGENVPMSKPLEPTIPKTVIKDTETLIASTLDEISARERNNHIISKHVADLVPDLSRREFLSTVIEHPELAKDLAPNELKVFEKLKSSFEEVGSRAKDAEVIKGMKENYISHIVDWSKTATKMDDAINYFLGKGHDYTATGRTSSKFGKERKYETIEELNKALEGSGLSLKTKDAAEIFKIYSNSMEKAIAGKSLVAKLKEAKLPDGTHLLHNIQQGGFIPKGWKTTNSNYLQGYAVHPELAPLMEHMFSNNSPHEVVKAAIAISNLSKRINVAGSLFHAASLSQALMSSGFRSFGKEVATGFKGTRAAVKDFQNGGLGDTADKWMKSGLKLEVPGDVDIQALGHIGNVVDSISSKAGLELATGKHLSTLEKNTIGHLDKVTWDYAHTGFKLITADKYLEKAKLDHPNVPEEVLRKEIVNYVNNSFGGLNWGRIAAESSNKLVKAMTSPKGREVMNLIMFAPDWTASTLRAATSVFGEGSGFKGLVKPRYQADFARRYQLRSALVYLTLVDGVNLITSGHHVWENEKDKTRIDFGDGTTMQLSKHAMEPVHWALHPEKTLANKLGFWPKAAIMYYGEKEYPFGPPMADTSLASKAGNIAEEMLPFAAKAAMEAPEGEGAERALLGTLGLPIYGMTTEERRKKRLERKIDAQRKKIESKEKSY